MILSKIKDNCVNVANTLYSVYKSDMDNGLIFPTYSDDITLRISEQEAKILFCNELIEYKEIVFSIETPTKLRYAGFAKHKPVVYNSGINGSSASIDLSIYDKSNHIIPIVNIEFKSGQPSISNIQKDLLKLYSEPGDGIWFHLHKTTNTQETIKCLVNKFNLSIENIINFYKSKNIEYVSDKDFFNLSKEIYLFLVLLNKNESNPIIKKCSVRISKNKELIYENNELKYVTIK